MKPTSALKERMLRMLSDAATADVTFIVGDDQVRIPAHSQVLAAASDSFKAMFYGDFNREKDVTIPDASPNGFRALLRYIYTDDAGISEDNVDSLIRLSDKYLLHELFAECVAWMKKNVKASNVCRFLPMAELYTELSEPCLRVIVESSSEVLASHSFRGLSLKLACQVLSMDRLRVREVVVWAKAIAWTSEHLESIDRPVNDTEIRRVMGDLVHTVRYPLMSRIEFVERVASRGILTTEEKLDLLLCYDTGRVPEGFTSAPREGVPDLVQFRTRHCVSCGHQSDVPMESECPACYRKHVTVIECGEHDRAFILGDDAWDFVSCAGNPKVETFDIADQICTTVAYRCACGRACQCDLDVDDVTSSVICTCSWCDRRVLIEGDVHGVNSIEEVEGSESESDDEMDTTDE